MAVIHRERRHQGLPAVPHREGAGGPACQALAGTPDEQPEVLLDLLNGDDLSHQNR